MIKRIVCIILCAAMIFAVMTVSVSAAKFVSNVNITVVAPVTGSVAVRSVTMPDGTADYQVTKVLWQDIDDNHRVLDEGETFKPGHVYVLGVVLKALNGKIFSEDRSTVTVNGSKTDWYVSGGSDGNSEIAIIEHTFPKTSVGYAINLPISDVTMPMAGQSPDWDIVCDWEGATITAMGWQCVENGKTVFSYSDQSAKDEFVFLSGCTYKVAVALNIKDGYELYEYFSASVNGQFANGTWNLTGKMAVVEYTFPVCEFVVSESVPGDANCDTNVNLSDVSLILKHVAGWGVEIDLAASDVTADDSVNLSDASLILKYIAGWDVELR